MGDINLKMKDGTSREFKQQSRPGGSYYQTMKFEPGFVIITDVWGKKTCIPTSDVAEIVEDSHERARW